MSNDRLVWSSDLGRFCETETERLQVERARSVWQKRNRVQRWETHICPQKLVAWTLSSINNVSTRQQSAVNQWVADPTRSVFFSGSVGQGKSGTCAAMVREAYVAGKDVTFVAAVEMFERLQPNATKPLHVTDLCEVDILVIDDLGKEKSSDWKTERLFYIANCRWENMLPTMVTSNKSVMDLQKIFGEATLDRLFDGALQLTFAKGSSLRNSMEVVN